MQSPPNSRTSNLKFLTSPLAQPMDHRGYVRNVVPSEIQHMPCTGGLVPGDRVAALRELLVVPKGRIPVLCRWCPSFAIWWVGASADGRPWIDKNSHVFEFFPVAHVIFKFVFQPTKTSDVFFQKHPWTRPIMWPFQVPRALWWALLVRSPAAWPCALPLRRRKAAKKWCLGTPDFSRIRDPKIQGFGASCGCFLKWWHPQNTPKWSFLVGKPMVVGCHHFRKSPMFSKFLPKKPWNFNMELPEMEVWKVMEAFQWMWFLGSSR